VALKEDDVYPALPGVELKHIYDIVIPARTLKHRRSRKESLSRDESDKLARLVRVFDQEMIAMIESKRAEFDPRLLKHLGG